MAVTGRPKVVVVGAGPAGGACALGLARRGGAEVLLLDKSTYPRLKVCGSGLSPHGLELLGDLELRDHFAADGAHAHMPRLVARGPSGREVVVEGRSGAWVVPRTQLDAAVVGEAVRHGATFREDTKVTELVHDARGHVVGVATDGGTIEADLVVVATGSPTRFAPDADTGIAIRTIMGWWRGAKMRSDQATMVWDRRLAGYYAWAFPEPGDVFNIGLTIPEDAPDAARLKPLFQELLDEHFGAALVGAEQQGKWMGHPATCTTRIGTVATTRALWIGEAAHLVSPGTVEGISFAWESGLLAAQTIAGHFDRTRGFGAGQRAWLRSQLVTRMLPKFWAGAGFARLMRSDRALDVTSKLFEASWLAEHASRLVGQRAGHAEP